MRFEKIISLLFLLPLCIACTNGKTHFMDQRMGFFITSTGFSDSAGLAIGGNFGGITPADDKCRSLALAAGDFGHKTWHAYLSYHAGAGVGNFANARDRIGAGPWYNQAGEIFSADLNSLHSTSPAARLFLTETGNLISANEFIMTGTDAEGILLFNCGSYTSNSGGQLMAYGQPGNRWNYAGAAGQSACDAASFQSLGTKARFYCFAAD